MLNVNNNNNNNNNNEIGVGMEPVWTLDKKKTQLGIGPQTVGCLTRRVGFANMMSFMLVFVNRHVACLNPEHSAVHRKA